MGVADDLTVKGEFLRKDAVFRDWIPGQSLGEVNPNDPNSKFKYPAESGRYHLYVSLACPWAHRTLIVRKLKGLEDVIGLSVVHYLMLEKGWEFKSEQEVPGCIPDSVNNFSTIKELYLSVCPDYAGRFTVPVLYDKQTKQIVSNESSEIIRMFNSSFNNFASRPELDLYPVALREKIDALNGWIYDGFNNGVYKAGFATSQEAHEMNSKLVRDTLLKVESTLSSSGGPWLLGSVFTEADIRLWTSAIRHDPVYFGHFKCNLVSIRRLPATLAWMTALYKMGGVKETVNMEHIKRHYYMSHRHINPLGIVPLDNGPLED